MANPLSKFANVSSLVPPQMLREQLSKIPAYRSNRERAAVVLRQGLDAYETYVRARPIVFFASLAGAAACGYALWWRRRNIAEAKVLYGGGLAACLALAWVTRPPSASPAVAAAKPEEKAGAGVVAAIDAKRAAYAAADPAWADKVMARVAALPGVREEVAAAPILRAVLG